ncbi:8673_t:CDS:2, partial [Gigaspora margarita]
SKKSLEPSAVEACSLGLFLIKRASLKILKAKEHSFYLVPQDEGNTGFGLKFFQGKNMFATMSKKSFNRETRDVVVQDGTPFPSFILTLYAIYYDY